MAFSDGKHWAEGRKSTFTNFVVGEETAESRSSVFLQPYGIAVRNGKIYVCDIPGHTVHVIDIPKKTYQPLGPPGKIAAPVHVTIDSDGTKYVCDTSRNMVLVYDASDQFVREFGEPRSLSPIDLAISGDELFIANVTGGEVQVWSKKDGSFLRKISHKGEGPDELRTPCNLAIGPDNHLYVSDLFLQQIKIFDLKGRFSARLADPEAESARSLAPKASSSIRTATFTCPIRSGTWCKSSTRIARCSWPWALQANSLGHGPARRLGDRCHEHPLFQVLLDPDFNCEYLLFVVNQFKTKDKVTVWAYGRSRKFKDKDYEINWEAVKKGIEALKTEEEKAKEGDGDPTTRLARPIRLLISFRQTIGTTAGFRRPWLFYTDCLKFGRGFWVARAREVFTACPCLPGRQEHRQASTRARATRPRTFFHSNSWVPYSR